MEEIKYNLKDYYKSMSEYYASLAQVTDVDNRFIPSDLDDTKNSVCSKQEGGKEIPYISIA